VRAICRALPHGIWNENRYLHNDHQCPEYPFSSAFCNMFEIYNTKCDQYRIKADGIIPFRTHVNIQGDGENISYPDKPIDHKRTVTHKRNSSSTG
jgi:hypothetical protein